MALKDIKGYAWGQRIQDSAQMRIEQIRTAVIPVLSSNLLPHFTDHSMDHSDRVIGILGSILERNLESNDRTSLNERELQVLLMSALLHDLALQIPKAYGISADITEISSADLKRMRSSHGEVSSIILREIADGKDNYELGISQPDVKKFLPFVASVCEKHQSSTTYDSGAVTAMGSERIRIGLLTALLRLADQLDCDSRRVRMEYLKHYSIPLDSIVHWIMCHYIDAVVIEKGFVEIYASYPETVSGPILELLSKKIIDRLWTEYRPCEKSLWQNNIIMRLPDAILQTGAAYSSPKITIPEAVIEEIRTQLSGVEPQHVQAMVSASASSAGSIDFMTYWSFVGNPFLDRPVFYGSDLFVETPTVAEILNETGKHMEGKTGDFRLVIGGRGMGKTTLYKSIEARFSGRYSTHIIDVADRVLNVRSSSDLHRIILTSIKDSLKPEEEDTRPERLIELASMGRKKIICIDSLDRLPDDKQEAVRDFFKTSQRFLTDLRGKAVVFMAFAENWGSMLSRKEFSYLGLRNQWKLEPFNTVQIVDMLSRRLKSSGRDYDEVFDESCSVALHTLSSGNPRAVLDHAQAICRLAAKQGVKRVTSDFIYRCYQEDFDEALADLMTSLAESSESVKSGLVSIYLFYLDMERRNLNPAEGWNYLLQMTKGEVPKDSIPINFHSSVSMVGYLSSTSDGTKTVTCYKLSKNIAELFSKLKKKGFAPEHFISFYAANPRRPVAEDDEQLVHLKSPLMKGEDVAHYERATQLFLELGKPSRPAFQTITMAWECAEEMIVAILTKYSGFSSQKLDIAKEEAFYEDKVGIKRQRTDGGKILSQVANELVKEFAGFLKDSNLWMTSLQGLNWIKGTRNNIVRGRSQYLMQYGERERDLCLKHIDVVYRELVRIFEEGKIRGRKLSPR